MIIFYADSCSGLHQKRSKIDQILRCVTLCICLPILISGCAGKAVYGDKNFNPPVYFGRHVVRQGETLYSIAWRYGRDFKELASTNNIVAPYVIVPGQIIDLEKSLSSSYRPAKEAVIGRQSASGKVPNVTKRKQGNNKQSKTTNLKKHKNIKDIKWMWPHVGPIIANYKITTGSKSVNKGIDISGRLGDEVVAAAAGEVVYSGNGLLGYGQLIIINHNEQFLSAYAHNRRILVKEGQKVKQGQKIAEMGKSGTNRVKLHFEIRKNGNPVNPRKYLPAKRSR